MKINITKKSLKLIQSLLLMTTVFTAQADDTEVFFTESEVNSNVLFVMDNSFSMSYPVAGTSTENTTITASFPITHGSDDAEEWITSTASTRRAIRNDLRTNRGSSDIGMTMDWKDDSPSIRENTSPQQQRVGLRFTDINIPQGTNIISASIQFTADGNDYDMHSEATNLNIFVEASNNAIRYGGGVSNIGSRNYYDSNPVAWVPAPWITQNENGPAQKTPDLTNLVQMIVNRTGWRENNAIAFKIEGTGIRSAYAFNSARNNNNVEPAILKIQYSAPPGLKTRMQVMQDALRIVLADAPTNLSVGVMNYGDVTGNRKEKANGIKFAVSPVNSLARPIVERALTVSGAVNWSLSAIPQPNASVTVGNFLSEITNDWEPNGYTPIVDALYEAALYYKGEDLFFGNGRANKKWASHPTTYAHPDPNEVLPITSTTNVDSCDARPKEHIIRNNNIAKWRNGETGGHKCPADRFAPSGPGLASNCAATEHSCRTSGWYRPCTERDPRVCAEWGEGGCRRYTGGQCLARGPSTRDRSCTYSLCKDSKKPVPKYITPIVSECQSNNVILMSDGQPEYEDINSKPKAYDEVRSMISADYASCNNSPSGFKNGACGKELTHHLAGITLEGTEIPNADLISDVNGQNLVNTFVIGFSSGISDEAEEYLKDLVTVVDDIETDNKEGYFPAQNEAQLAAAFKSLLDEIAQEARSQASPGYSVNVKSGLEHEDDIYIPVFDKRNSSRWSGNLKKFKLVDDGGHRSIRGRPEDRLIANSNADDDYIDAMTEQGLFKDTAWDEWSKSATPDGDVVEAGGTASLLTDPGARKLYSNLTGNTNISLATGINNTINTSSAITTNLLGLDLSTLPNQPSQQEMSDYKDKLINYIRGWTDGIADPNFDPDSDNNVGSARLHMGDMLHSEPVVITYQTADDQGSGKRQYIFAATNEGYLHAFDASTGLEQFAFMPKELLKNVSNQFTGEGEHKYGIDGQISYWHNDENNNGNVDGSEHVWLYFGLRRGGHSYYALDVTNIDRPILKWVINNDTSGFSDLGQTWSMPYIANVLVDGTKTPAVIFTGGNDIDQDYGKGESYTEASVTGNITADEGKNIYIVNASNGHLLWKMSSKVNNYSELTHAIPGGARILDVNRNGLLDRMYFADTGGDVWRLDLGEDLTTGRSTLEKFATLGGSSANSRKFYNEPDVAMLRANGQLIYTVSIGSGLRPHPVNDIINDHMFVLLDRSPLAALPSDYDPIVIGDLAKVEIGKAENGKTTLTHDEGFGGEADDKAITNLEDSSGHKKKGWYVEFGEEGEKVLATSMTFEGSLMFTTLVPEPADIDDSSNICTVAGTHGRIYIMDILTGEASSNLDDADSDLNDNDVFEVIASGEIPGTPQTVANQLECTGDNCAHLFDIRIGKKNTEASVSNVADVESIYWTDPVGK